MDITFVTLETAKHIQRGTQKVQNIHANQN